MKYFYFKFLRQTQWRVVSCSLLFYYIFFFICFTSLSLCCCCWTVVVVVGNFLLYKNIQTISQSVNMTTVASILTWEHRHFFVDREIYAQRRTDGQGDGGREKDKTLNMYEGKDDDGTTKKKKIASRCVAHGSHSSYEWRDNKLRQRGFNSPCARSRVCECRGALESGDSKFSVEISCVGFVAIVDVTAVSIGWNTRYGKDQQMRPRTTHTNGL